MKTTSNSFRNIILLILASIVLSLLVTGIVKEGISPVPTLTPTAIAPAKMFKPVDLFVEERWRRSILIYSPNESHMILAGNKIIVEDSKDRKILALNSQTGDKIWAVSVNKGSLWSMNADEKTVYVVEGDGIMAYDLETSQRRWHNETAKDRRHGWHWVDVTQTSLNYYFDYRVFVKLDKDTGQIQERIEENGEIIYFWRDEILYTTQNKQLSAIDTANNQQLWAVDINGRPQYWPVVLDEVMYVATASPYVGAGKRTITAINLITGEKIWQIQTYFLSNITVAYGLLFVIDIDGDILTWDVDTAEPMGKIIVGPKPFSTISQGCCSLVASEQFLVAYYGDSQDLTLFEFLEAAE